MATTTAAASTAASADEADPKDRYTVGSVARALTILETVGAAGDDGITVSEISRSLGTSKSTAFALVRTLVARGFLREVQPGPRYHLGMALVRLGDESSRGFPLGRVCEPILLQLSRDTGLTTRAAISDHGYPIFIARVDSPGAIRFHTALGVRELPHTSSAGKAILAQMSAAEVSALIAETGLPRRTRKTITTAADLELDLDATRRRGYAIDDEEDVEGIFCVAAPFFDRAGRVTGAVSATGIKLDQTPRQIEELGHAVQRAAASVSALVSDDGRTGVMM